VYVVESEELDGEPRVVRCCGCLHEWYARDSDLLWGEREAAAAIEAERHERQRESLRGRRAAPPPGVGHGDGRRGEAGVGDHDLAPWSAGQGLAADSRHERGGGPPPQRDGPPADGPPAPRQAGDDPRAGDVDDASLPPTSSIAPPAQLGDRPGGAISSPAPPAPSPPSEGRASVVFCGNLSFRATEEDLFVAFSGYGVLIKCQIPMDASGSSRGYGFVQFANEADAETAIECLQGISILGRDVSLSKARPRYGGGGGAMRYGSRLGNGGGGDGRP
jgi:hypothetical protein